MANNSNIDANDRPVVDASVTFLSMADGGRNVIPDFNFIPSYRPHIVIQDPTTRTATYDEQGMGNEHYLGVEFIGGSENPEFGVVSQCKLRLAYHPRVDYSAVQDGATFTVREGGRIVGFGVIESR